MQQLTQQGQNIVNDLSRRHGFSTDATTHMLIAVMNGNGAMAQFSHSEFGGSGQWMRGGMLMLGDMFNNYLKGRVDSLCYEIADILAREPGLLQSGSFQSQSQGNGSQQQGAGGVMGESSLFVPNPANNWWPKDLGAPNATGNQNDIRYAYFSYPRRLAVQTNGQVWIYDTLDHQIGGFSQQQGSGGSILFSSQYGTVNLSTLPVISIDGQTPAPIAPPAPAPANNNNPAPSSSGANSGDIFSAIERLGDLLAKGILTEQEFNQKKAELLSRL